MHADEELTGKLKRAVDEVKGQTAPADAAQRAVDRAAGITRRARPWGTYLRVGAVAATVLIPLLAALSGWPTGAGDRKRDDSVAALDFGVQAQIIEDVANDPEVALGHIDRMTERERYRTRGNYYVQTQNVDGAIQEFTSLVEKYPADNAGLANLALAYFYRRDMQHAAFYITTPGKLTLAPGARVDGDVRSGWLDLYDGAMLNGAARGCED